jgi:hypothetical protein
MKKRTPKQIVAKWDKEFKEVLKKLKREDKESHRDDFLEIIEKMKEIHQIKDHDYAGESYLSNLKGSERIGIPAWKGTLIRMEDKMARLENFAKQDFLLVKDESIEDTFIDLATYSILALILYRNRDK